MTPADEWATTDDPQRLLALASEAFTLTAARLFAAGYFRHRHEHHDPLPKSPLAWLDEYERLALEGATGSAWDKLRQRTPRGRAYAVHTLAPYFCPECTAVDLNFNLPTLYCGHAVMAASHAAGPPPADVHPGHEWHRRFQAAYFAAIRPAVELIRCVILNPLRDVSFDDSWRTSTAVGLAQTMFDARAFDAMPILADALQDAGCEDADVLNHCRLDETHTRGCWVVEGGLNRAN